MIPTGWYFEREKSLFAEVKILGLELPIRVTALSDASAMASLFKIAISAVICCLGPA